MFREQAHSTMPTTTATSQREPRVRYHVSEATAAKLSLVRREGNYRSWDEFFTAVVRKFDDTPPISPARLEAKDLKMVLTKLDTHRDFLLKILGTQESRDGLFSGLQAGLEEVQQTLVAIRGLLEVALGGNDKIGEPAAQSGGVTSRLRQRLEKRGKA